MTGNDRLPEAKRRAAESIARHRDQLISLSHQIHAHPELAFEETRAAGWLGDALAGHGFDVDAGICGLPTAFAATAGHGPITMVLCAEYDALPLIGHACGHNIIAATALGAGIALRPLADELGITVRVLGTPGEEGGGGKILMLQRGAFDGANAVLMAHPASQDHAEMGTLAVSHFDVRYRGVAAHASSAPWNGVNAADALTVAQVAIGLLRQHLRPSDQVHGIVTDGGSAANIIPDRAVARYYARAQTTSRLEVLRERLVRCFESGALATGAELEVEDSSPVYAELRSDPILKELYRRNGELVGRNVLSDVAPALRASTDLGNVSQRIPTIHPLIGIDAGGSSNHQPEFARACASPSADQAVIDGALMLVWTVIDAATDGAVREHIRSELAVEEPRVEEESVKG